MLSRGFRKVKITCPDQGEIHLMYPIPKPDNPLGVLSKVDKEWLKHIPSISGENLSHALHGWATPLVRELPAHPHLTMKRIKPKAMCRSHKGGAKKGGDCLMANDKCYPNKDTPECYDAPVETFEKRMLISEIVLAWKSGIYVVTIKGSEFII